MGGLKKRIRHDAVYYPARAFLAAGGLMPLSVARPVGAAVGRLALLLAGTDRRRAREHLAVAFPELTPGERERILRRTARHLGLTLAEVLWLWRATPGDVDRLVATEGFHHLEAALAAGRGAVLITGHLGNWELLNARLSTAGIPMSIAVREVYDPRLHVLATRLRARFGTEVIPRGADAGKRLAAALRRNRVVGLLIDQDIRDVSGVFVPFFGRLAWTPLGAAMLAIRNGAPVIPAFSHRRPDGSHLARALSPLPVPEGGSLRERVRDLTAAATAAIETQIRAHPEQWVWMHRRWRTRPQA